jgi:hypothetical protein
VFWKMQKGNPLRNEKDKSLEEISQGACESGIIPSPKSQEGQCRVARRAQVCARAEVEFRCQISGGTTF